MRNCAHNAFKTRKECAIAHTCVLSVAQKIPMGRALHTDHDEKRLWLPMAPCLERPTTSLLNLGCVPGRVHQTSECVTSHSVGGNTCFYPPKGNCGVLNTEGPHEGEFEQESV